MQLGISSMLISLILRWREQLQKDMHLRQKVRQEDNIQTLWGSV